VGRRGGRDDRDLNLFWVVVEKKKIAVVVVAEMMVERMISFSLEAVEDAAVAVVVVAFACYPTVMVGSPVNLPHLVVHLVVHHRHSPLPP